jgi:hypothetical protein
LVTPLVFSLDFQLGEAFSNNFVIIPFSLVAIIASYFCEESFFVTENNGDGSQQPTTGNQQP